MDSELEIWKEIPDYDGKYLVSSLGRVKSIKREKFIILKPAKDRHGYLWVCLCKTGIRYRHYIHKLVISVFMTYDKALVSDHINSIRTDNRLINLRQITQSENIKRRLDYVAKRRSGNTGVTWCKTNNKWVSRISINGKEKFIGYFKLKDDALAAYKKEDSKLIIP